MVNANIIWLLIFHSIFFTCSNVKLSLIFQRAQYEWRRGHERREGELEKVNVGYGEGGRGNEEWGVIPFSNSVRPLRVFVNDVSVLVIRYDDALHSVCVRHDQFIVIARLASVIHHSRRRKLHYPYRDTWGYFLTFSKRCSYRSHHHRGRTSLNIYAMIKIII